MKFRRNVHLYRGSLDAAPVATIFFLLVIFLLLGSRIYTPGVHIKLPSAANASGTDKRSVSVAVDANGRFYFENQLIQSLELKSRLSALATNYAEPPVLLIFADKAVTAEHLAVLQELAAAAGIRDAYEARVPAGDSPPAPKAKAP